MKTQILVVLAAVAAYLIALVLAVALTTGPALFLVGSLAIVVAFRLAHAIADWLEA